jgi:hypothetical protein
VAGPSFDRDLTPYMTGKCSFVAPTERAIMLLQRAGLSQDDAWDLLSDVAQEYRDWKEVIEEVEYSHVWMEEFGQ